MKNTELNRDVRKFVKQIKAGKINPTGAEAREEFSRLYAADKTLKSHNADSLRLIIGLNCKYEYLPVHRFGLHVEL